MRRSPEFSGPHFSVECLELADGSCPAGEFLDALPSSDRRKIDVLFEMIGATGRIANKEKFKKLSDSDNIWQFKSNQIRILCFFAPGKRVMLAFGVKKKQDRHNAKEILRAERYREWFLQSG